MFDVEIDKFKRVLAMKQYKLIREQRELHPDLEISDTNDTFTMLVWRKDPHKRKYNTMLRLEATTINNNMKYMDRIAMYESNEERVREELDMMYSGLFKREANHSAMSDQTIMQRCIDGILDIVSPSFYFFYPYYKRKLLDEEGRGVKDYFLNALIHNDLEVSGQTYPHILDNFVRDDTLLNDYVTKKMDKDSSWHM